MPYIRRRHDAYAGGKFVVYCRERLQCELVIHNLLSTFVAISSAFGAKISMCICLDEHVSVMIKNSPPHTFFYFYRSKSFSLKEIIVIGLCVIGVHRDRLCKLPEDDRASILYIVQCIVFYKKVEIYCNGFTFCCSSDLN